jgi:CRP-like cAMP-binding protein
MLNFTHEYVRHLSPSLKPATLHTPRQNQLLALLPDELFDRLEPELELMEMPAGMTLYGPGDIRTHAYFPTTCIISILYDTENGKSSQIALTGNDGFVGVVIAMGADSNTMHTAVQTPGFAYRIKASAVKKYMLEDAFQHVVLLYTQLLITQMGLTAVCNRHHSIDQQFCRWLLLSLDRLEYDELNITHEQISNILGVRREGITQAARRLQSANAIHYSRGHMKILDRGTLEDGVCECYQVFKKECDRLLNHAGSKSY